MKLVWCGMLLFTVISLYLPATLSNDLSRCQYTDTVMNCSSAEFTSVPTEEEVSPGTQVLILSNNHIHNVTEFSILTASSSLHTLVLSNNMISIITPMCFTLLVNLQHLDLSENLIEGVKLEEHMFHDLRKLKTLDLSKNPLRIIKKDTFNFIQIPLVTKLDLSHSEIYELESSSIDLPNLEFLDLSWNHLTTLTASSLRMLVSLRTLDMSHNDIRVLYEVPVLPEIVTWILDSNNIDELRLRDEIWDNAESLQMLSLRNNDLIYLNKESLPLDLDTLVVIDLANNYIQCDCKMTWLKYEDIQRDRRNFTIPCKYPSALRGINLLDVPADELVCTIPVLHIVLLAVFIFIVSLCTGLLFYFLCRARCKRRTKKAPKADHGGDYTAVYTKDEDDDDVRVAFSDNKKLINESREFDV